MKIHRPLTYLLIIGILGLTTTSAAEAKFPELLKISGFDMGVIAEQIEEKCKENGGPTAFEHFKNSPKYFKDCVSSVVDVTVLRQEIDAAAAQGELDTLFGEYCDRVPGLKKCMRNLTDTFALCLEREEKGNFEIINNITDSLLKFACHNEGDRITMFMVSGGVECIRYKRPEIEACRDETIGKYFRNVQNVGPELFNFPSLFMTRKDCTDIEEFSACVVSVLETCPDPTPGNVVDSLLHVVRTVTPCEGLLKPPRPPTSTDMTAIVDHEQEAVETKRPRKEELEEKSLVKQIEAAEAQVRAANAQERAAIAQEQTAKVLEQVGKTWLSRNPNRRYPARW